jgi:hypothetical protein
MSNFSFRGTLEGMRFESIDDIDRWMDIDIFDA